MVGMDLIVPPRRGRWRVVGRRAAGGRQGHPPTRQSSERARGRQTTTGAPLRPLYPGGPGCPHELVTTHQAAASGNAGTDAGMQDRGQQLGAVDDARAGAREVRVGVDRDDARRTRRGRRGGGLGGSAGGVVAARCDDAHVGRGGPHGVPVRGERRRARLAEDLAAAGDVDELGHPVAGGERRVDPLGHEDVGPRGARPRPRPRRRGARAAPGRARARGCRRRAGRRARRSPAARPRPSSARARRSRRPRRPRASRGGRRRRRRRTRCTGSASR